MKILHEIKYRCSSVNRTSRLPGLGNWKRFLFLKYQLKFALFPTKINQCRCESFNKSTGNKRTLSWFRVEVNNRRQCYRYVRIWLADTDDSVLWASDAFTVFWEKVQLLHHVPQSNALLLCQWNKGAVHTFSHLVATVTVEVGTDEIWSVLVQSFSWRRVAWWENLTSKFKLRFCTTTPHHKEEY